VAAIGAVVAEVAAADVESAASGATAVSVANARPVKRAKPGHRVRRRKDSVRRVPRQGRRRRSGAREAVSASASDPLVLRVKRAWSQKQRRLLKLRPATHQ
jgi:hypothetical protein